MYTEQPIDEYNESLDTGTELKAHKRLRRIMRITQEMKRIKLGWYKVLDNPNTVETLAQ